MSQPTQVQFKGRAVVRTLIQVGIPAVLALGVVVPEAVQIILEAGGGAMPEGLRATLLGVAAAVTATAGALARIMAIPKIEGFLRSQRFLRWLAAEPEPVPPVDVDPDAGDARGFIGRHDPS